MTTRMMRTARAFDGGYAEYTLVPRTNIVPFVSDLPWETIGAVPETLQTPYGSLTTGLDLKAGQVLLIHGGTSALGLVTTTPAKASATSSSTMETSRHKCASGVRTALTPPWKSSAPPRCPALSPPRVSMAGMLPNEWIVPGPTHVYPLDDVRRAPDDLEHDRVFGKLVVRNG